MAKAVRAFLFSENCQECVQPILLLGIWLLMRKLLRNSRPNGESYRPTGKQEKSGQCNAAPV